MADSFLTFCDLLPSVKELEVYVGGDPMKRLMYVIPLSSIAVLVFAAIAAAQPATVPAEQTAPAESATPMPSTRPSSTLLRVRQSRSSITTMCLTPSPQTTDCSTQRS